MNYKIGAAAFGALIIPLVVAVSASTSAAPNQTMSDQVTTPVALVDAGHETDFVAHGTTVAEALAEAGIALGSADSVSPGLDTQLTGVDTTVTVDRGIPTAIYEGGQLALRGESPAGSTGDTLAGLGIPMGSGDTATASLAEDFLGSGLIGQSITITRGLSTETEGIPAPTQTKTDKTLTAGTTKVLQEGQPGSKQVTFRYVWQGGTSFDKEVVSDVTLTNPVPQLVVKGTKAAAPQASVVVAGSDSWARLRQCEAGGNYARNSGNGYYGAYQFDLGTWNGYGGYVYPSDAPPAVQDAKAQETQARRGWSPWPACAHKLGLL